jgi:glycosyltransferase involved in cell wall biosynthesis
MSKVSVIIPSRNERYLPDTLRDIFANRAGDIEVIVVLDGDYPDYDIPDYPGLKFLHNKKVKGLRYSVNRAVDFAKGKYILKIDAHCTIGEGWDEILQADCEDNWMVAPRRYLWDAPMWNYKKNADGSISYIDAHYYFYPFIRPYNPRLTSRPWVDRANERARYLIDEDMSCQGSCWFMPKSLFKRIGGFNEFGYGTFSSEPEELGLKIQLGPVGGMVMRNKKTWFSHWDKPSIHWKTAPEIAGRVPDEERIAGNYYCFDYWFYNRWEERVHDFEWLIDKFWPIPTWPDDWRWRSTQYDIYELPKVNYG